MRNLTFNILITVSFCLIITSCKSKQIDEINNSKGPRTIKIEGDIKTFVPNETFISKILPIPLETNDSCLVESVRKTIIKDNYVFIQNSSNNILIFDIEGNFIRQIGQRGRGPSEYSSVYDFCIDKHLNIHIASARSIYIFTFENHFVKKIAIKPYKKFDLIAEQIICDGDFGYYFWKGFHYVNETNNNLPQHLIRIDENQKITGKYISLSYSDATRVDIFHKYKNSYNMDPPYGCDTIYSIDSNGVQARYYLDFGKRSLARYDFKWKTYGEYREYFIDKDVVTEVRDFIETDNLIYFRFIYKNYIHNAIIDKRHNKVYAYEPKREDPPLSSLIMMIDGEWEGNMFAVIEPIYIIEKLEMLDDPKYSGTMTRQHKKLIKQLANIKETDNPIVFICELKND